MAEVVVTFKVLPKDIDVNLDKLENEIKNVIKPERIEREPIAFGLFALKVIKVMPDSSGVLEETENKLKSIIDVGEVEVVELGRSL
jgi:translation elongation factor aEF-1 beta